VIGWFHEKGDGVVEPIWVETVRRSAPFTMEQEHGHAAYEVYYLAEGRRRYFIRDQTYRIEAGTLVFIDRFELHRTLDDGVAEHERILIQFTEQWLDRLTPEERRWVYLPFDGGGSLLRLSMRERGYAEDLLRRMAKEWRERAEGYELCLRALFVQLFVYIGRLLRGRREQEDAGEQPAHPRIAEVARYVAERCAAQAAGKFDDAEDGGAVRLAAVARRFGLSPYYLSRAFRRETGFTFTEYVSAVRLKEAQRLLRETDARVVDVAAAVGYRNLSHFGRAFRRFAGCSPLQYRKSYR